MTWETGYYAELTETSDIIEKIGDETINMSAADLAANYPDDYGIANNTPTTFPDLLLKTDKAVQIDSNITGGGAFGGSHPPVPTRPRP